MEMKMSEQLRLLFLCTGNACRSQMAEGWANHFFPDTLAATSAGVVKTVVDPKAREVMAEVGVDISGQFSKHLSELESLDFDYVITLCDHAAQHCPVFPGQAVVLHHPFPDPPQLARSLSTQKAILDVYREVRDAIREYIRNVQDELPEKQPIEPPRLR